MKNYQQQMDLLNLHSYDYHKCMFVDSLTEYIGPPNYIHYQVWSVNKI